MSQTAFWDKLQEAGLEKRWKGKYVGERERKRRRESILQHYGASSIIQMAAVPLHLFSLLGLNIKMAAPKETDIQKMKPTQRAKAECTRLLASPPQHLMNASQCSWLHDFDGRGIPVTFGLNSMKDRLRDCVINTKWACNLYPNTQEMPTPLRSALRCRSPGPEAPFGGWAGSDQILWHDHLDYEKLRSALCQAWIGHQTPKIIVWLDFGHSC